MFESIKNYKKREPNKFKVIVGIIISVIVIVLTIIFIIIGDAFGWWKKKEVVVPPKTPPTPTPTPTPTPPPKNVPIKLISSDIVRIYTPNGPYLSSIAFENSLTVHITNSPNESSQWKINIYEEIIDYITIKTCTIQNMQGLYLSNTRIPDYPQHITLDNVQTFWTIKKSFYVADSFHLKMGNEYLATCDTCIRNLPNSCYLQDYQYIINSLWKLEPVVIV